MHARLMLGLLLLAPATAATPAPPVTAESLNGEEGVVLPPAARTVLLIAFQREHNDIVTTWFDALVPLEKDHHFTTIQLNVMEDPGFFLRNLIQGVMRMKYDDRRQSRTYMAFTDPVAFCKKWGIVDDKHVVVVVLDALRNPIATERGDFDTDRLSRLRHTLGQ